MYGSLEEGGGYSRFLESSYDKSVQLAFFKIDGERRIKSYNTDKRQYYILVEQIIDFLLNN